MQPLAAQSALAAAKTSGGGALLLSIDQGGLLRITARLDGHADGWISHTVSSELTDKYPVGTTVKAKAFGVTQSQDTGPITILVVVNIKEPGVTGTSYDDVWMLSGLDSSTTARWLTDPAARAWVTRRFDFTSSDFPSLGAANLSVADVHLARVVGQVSAPALAAVTVTDPASKIKRPFLVNLNPTVASGVWTYHLPGQSYTELLDSAVGQAFPSLSTGIYSLYTSVEGSADRVTALSFHPRVVTAPTALFAVPVGASAIASLPAGQSSGPFTDLLVAGDGTLTLVSYDAKTAQDQLRHGIVITSSPFISGVTELHAVTDQTTVSVWGLNGSNQLFYTQAPFSQRYTPGAWSPPLPLLRDVLRASPYLSDTRNLTTLFAVVKVAGSEKEALIELSKDPGPTQDAAPWIQRTINLPAPTAFLTLQSYTTRILLTDGSNLPVPDAEVTVTPSSACVLEINGLSYTATPSRPVVVTSDFTGEVSIVQEVSSLSAATYTVTVDGSAATIDPMAEVRQALSRITSGSDLLAATYTDSMGNQQPLLDSRKVSAENAHAVASLIQQILTPPLRANLAAVTAQTVGTEGSVGIAVAIGDLVQSLVHAIKDGYQAALHLLEEGWALVVKIGNKIFRAVIKTVEGAMGAVASLLQQIEVGVEKAFRWLASLFNWRDILKVRDALVSFYDQALDSAASSAASLKQRCNSWIDQLESKLRDKDARGNLFNSLGSQSGSSLLSRRPANTTVGSSDLRVDSRLGWVKTQLANMGASSLAPNSSVAAMTFATDLAKAFTDALNQLGSQVGQAFLGLASDSADLISGRVTAKQWLDKAVVLLAEFGLEVVRTVANAGLEMASSVAEAARAGLKQKIEIPVLSALYRHISGGHDLTMLDAICLLQSVVLTLSFKLATSAKDVSPLVLTLTGKSASQAIARLAQASPTGNPAVPQAMTTALSDLVGPDVRGSAAQFAQPVPSGQPDPTMVLAKAQPGEDQRERAIMGGALKIVHAYTLASHEVLNTNVTFSLDLIARFGLSVTALFGTVKQGEAPAVPLGMAFVDFVYGFIAAAAMGLSFSGVRGDEPKVMGELLRKIDWLVSGASGLIGIYGTIVGGCNLSPALYAATAAADLAQHFLKGNPQVATIVLAARTEACTLSGVVDLGKA
ncbi:MAG: hypothetical protein ACJ8AT_05150 [Hyalangium sp.]|uniref:hypothetical protein n=1 Tax=Hyalangium sp. TaxID=2028555 RepID=UPI003899990B